MADNSAASELCKSINGLFAQSRYSDFKIVCGNRSWKVHKAIICSRSEYFEKACAGQFKESSASSITLVDDPPNVINGMLRFLYTADCYDDAADEARDGYQPMSFNVDMYVAADKYGLETLSKLALKKFAGRAQHGWNSDDFADAVETIYTRAPSGRSALRITAVDIIRTHAKELLVEQEGFKLREVIGAVPELGLELCVGMTMDPVKDDVPAPVLEKKIPDDWYTCCSPATCGKVIFFTNVVPVLGLNYTCPHCGSLCAGKSLINRRKVAVTLLHEMHIQGR